MDSRQDNGDANGWVTALKTAQAAGLATNLELVSLDAPRQRELIVPCLPHLDMLVVNDAEICALAGLDDAPRHDLAACKNAAIAVLQMGAMDLVAVHCPLGGLVAGRDGTITIVPAFAIPAHAIRGPNGAGDAFAAGFLLAVHENKMADDALRLGHAAAACSLRRKGTTDGLERADACVAVARDWGVRDDGWR
jgi:sugar/nucleoside kinase (ribokinase family)